MNKEVGIPAAVQGTDSGVGATKDFLKALAFVLIMILVIWFGSNIPTMIDAAIAWVESLF